MVRVYEDFVKVAVVAFYWITRNYGSVMRISEEVLNDLTT